MQRTVKWVLILGIVLLVGLLLAGCGGSANESSTPTKQPEQVADAPAEQPKEPAEAPKFDYVSSDTQPDGCSSCHQGEFGLDKMLAKMQGHPPMPIQQVDGCLSCHASNGNMPFKTYLHRAHKPGIESGSCVQCHGLTEEGRVVVKGLATAGGKMVTIKSADADKAPEGCISCHTKSGENDHSLEAQTRAMNKETGHPVIPAESVQQCVTCHNGKTAPALGDVLHPAHLVGNDNHFVTSYGGSCKQCHAVGSDGAIKVKGL